MQRVLLSTCKTNPDGKQISETKSEKAARGQRFQEAGGRAFLTALKGK